MNYDKLEVITVACLFIYLYDRSGNTKYHLWMEDTTTAQQGIETLQLVQS